MYYYINYFLQNLAALYLPACASFCLTPKYHRGLSLTVNSIICASIILVRFMNFDIPACITACSLAMQLILFAFVMLSFRNTLYKKLIVFTVLYSCNLVSEFLGLLFLDTLGSYTLALEPHSREFTIALLFILPINFLLNHIFIFTWNYINHRNKNYPVLALSVFPMIQLLALSTIFAPLLIEPDLLSSSLMFICSLIATVSIVILLCLLLRRQEKQNIQVAYEELQALYQMENEYYQALESRHEELSKIRHDYNNQISALYMLIASDNLKAAKDLANSMKQQLK